jgi:hypothetical protein
MLNDTVTMILVLGGAGVCTALLYCALLPGRPPRTNKKTPSAEATAGLIASRGDRAPTDR